MFPSQLCYLFVASLAKRVQSVLVKPSAPTFLADLFSSRRFCKINEFPRLHFGSHFTERQSGEVNALCRLKLSKFPSLAVFGCPLGLRLIAVGEPLHCPTPPFCIRPFPKPFSLHDLAFHLHLKCILSPHPILPF